MSKTKQYRTDGDFVPAVVGISGGSCRARWEATIADSDPHSLQGEPVDAIGILSERPTAEYDEVRLQADYAARAMLSFYRFRQLGGGRVRDDEAPFLSLPQDTSTSADSAPETSRKLKLGRMEKNGIHYVSDHPDVRILQLSVIALLVLFESAANAYFFAQQSAFGISGGLFQAAAVSLANVACSFFIIGFWGLRHASTPANWSFDPRRWDARNYYKLFGILAIILGIGIVMLVNLSAAHYRNLIDMKAHGALEGASAAALAETTTNAFRFWFVSADTCDAILTSPLGQEIGSAATNAMCRPFALHSLDAMVLFALGLAISALAAFEGRGADAAFPGLSDAARQFEKAKQDLAYALEDYYDAIDDWIEDARDIMAGRRDDDRPAGATSDATSYRQMSLPEELRLRALLRDRVEPYQSLLTSDPDLLSDEFGLEVDIVKSLGSNGRGRG